MSGEPIDFIPTAELELGHEIADAWIESIRGCTTCPNCGDHDPISVEQITFALLAHGDDSEPVAMIQTLALLAAVALRRLAVIEVAR
jgi:hypothetical protein